MNKFFIPVSIVVSGLIIAGAIFLTTKQQEKQAEPLDPANLELAISPITENDHILGNRDAEILIIEYSDFGCPFCKRFHETMKQVMEEYGPSGNVAWVYRHFPLSAQSRAVAEVSECVASLAGNEKFWEYIDGVYAEAPESLADDRYRTMALELGIDENQLTSCLASDIAKTNLEQHIADGQAIANVDRQFGTPYNILISKSGVQVPLRGAQPITNVRGAIDAILNE